jgi:hypothetical protein
VAKARTKIDVALLRVRNLIERMRAGAPAGSSPKRDGLSVSISRLGGFRVVGEEAAMLHDCERTLAELRAGSPELRELSREACGQLLRETIIRALRPKGAQNEPRARFDRRLRRELARLRKLLLAEPKQWLVTLPVHGLHRSGLPFAFGGVNFPPCDEAAVRRVAANIGRPYKPRRRVRVDRIDAENKGRSQLVDELVAEFAGHDALATVTVKAVDNTAAGRIGSARIRRAVDIINFFAPFFHERFDRHRSSVPPDAPRKLPPQVTTPAAGDGFHTTSAWPLDLAVTMIDLRSPRAVQIGLARASELLGLDAPPDLTQRILNGLAWAGRAVVEHRREQAFILFTIALEALLTNPRQRVGVTDRLRLRTAHLIGPDRASRILVASRMSELYQTRNAIVHAGDWQELTETDLANLREVVELSLTATLTHPRYVSMRGAAEFERWLDERLLGEEPPAAPAL